MRWCCCCCCGACLLACSLRSPHLFLRAPRLILIIHKSERLRPPSPPPTAQPSLCRGLRCIVYDYSVFCFIRTHQYDLNLTHRRSSFVASEKTNPGEHTFTRSISILFVLSQDTPGVRFLLTTTGGRRQAFTHTWAGDLESITPPPPYHIYIYHMICVDAAPSRKQLYQQLSHA